MTKTSKIKPGPQSEPREQSRRRFQASLTFDLPDSEEWLELAIQARKWRQLVHDIALQVMSWRDTAKSPEEASAYRSVNLILRDYLADFGLTIYTREQQEKFHQDNVERYAKHLDALIKKGGAAWRESMESEAEHTDHSQNAGETDANS